MMNIVNKNKRVLVSRFFALATLVVYLIAIAQSTVIHQWHHHEHAHELHSELQEQDPCHLAEYHQGVACGHETHLNQTESSCELCQIILSSQEQIEHSVPQIQADTPISLLTQDYDWPLKAIRVYTQPLRGPPALA